MQQSAKFGQACPKQSKQTTRAQNILAFFIFLFISIMLFQQKYYTIRMLIPISIYFIQNCINYLTELFIRIIYQNYCTKLLHKIITQNYYIKMQEEQNVIFKSYENPSTASFLASDGLQSKYVVFISKIIANASWSHQEVKRILSNIKEWKANSLIMYNDAPLLLKFIEDINFSKLIELNVSKNEIVSIQGICRIQMPVLSILNLNENQISKISSLKKTNFPCFRSIQIASCFTVDEQSLVEMETGNLVSVICTRVPYGWIVKMQARTVRTNKNRTLKVKLQKQLKNRKIEGLFDHLFGI